MSDRIDEALDAVEYLFRLVPEHTCYESFDAHLRPTPQP